MSSELILQRLLFFPCLILLDIKDLNLEEHEEWLLFELNLAAQNHIILKLLVFIG